MKRILLVAGLAFFGATASAAEVKGTVKSADKEKNAITVTVEGKETLFTLGKDAEVVTVKMVGKKNKQTEEKTAIENGLAGVKEGSQVTLVTDKKDDKEFVTAVKVTGEAETKKKKKKKEDK